MHVIDTLECDRRARIYNKSLMLWLHENASFAVMQEMFYVIGINIVTVPSLIDFLQCWRFVSPNISFNNPTRSWWRTLSIGRNLISTDCKLLHLEDSESRHVEEDFPFDLEFPRFLFGVPKNCTSDPISEAKHQRHKNSNVSCLKLWQCVCDIDTTQMVHITLQRCNLRCSKFGAFRRTLFST